MEPEAKRVVLPIERYQAALAAYDERQTDAFAISDARVVAKQVLTKAQETFDNLTKEWRGSEDALALLRYGLDVARADVEAELRESTARGVKVQAIISC